LRTNLKISCSSVEGGIDLKDEKVNKPRTCVYDFVIP